jgi:PAS domain S-box-containing protein
MSLRPSSMLLRYALGIGFVAAAAVAHILLAALAPTDASFALYVVAILAAASAGGLGPGFVAAALSAFLCAYPATDVTGSFDVRTTVDVALYFVAGVAVIIAVHHSAHARAETRDDRSSKKEQAEGGIPEASLVVPMEQARLQSILDASDARLFHLDSDFKLTWANRTLRKRHGIEDIAGAALTTLFDPQKRVALMRPLQRAMEGHCETLEWRALDAGGQSCWTYTMITPDLDARGKVRGCVVVCLDTTTRHLADVARQRNDDQRRGILESLPDLVWMATADGTGEWFNHRWAEFTGRSVADWLAPVHPEERQHACSDWQRALAEGTPLEIEVRLQRHDKEWRWHRVRAQPLRQSITDATVWGWCGSCTDVDDQKRAATALKTNQQRLTSFLGTLSHELRNPLAAISAAVQILRHPKALPDMTTRAMETLDRQVAFLARMVGELFDSAQVVSGKIDLQRRRVAINEIIRGVCESLAAGAADKGIALVWTTHATDPFIDADFLRIHQALENVVLNAINACALGDTVTVSPLSGSSGDVGLRVTDTGCGLSSDAIAQLLESDIVLDGAHPAGLGLGLATVNRIVELHGGRINVTSAGPGKGTTFDLYFPLYRDHDTDTVESVATRRTQRLPDQRVLIISRSATEIEGLLGQCGAELRSAMMGFEGLRIAEAWPVTAVLCDLDLPAPLSGYDVARQIRARPSPQRMHLVAIGEDDAIDLPTVKAAGFDEVLVRPISLQRLLDKLTMTDNPSPTAIVN